MTLSSSTHTALELDGYDLNLDQNSSRHCTEGFGKKQLIVRRGMPFYLTLQVKATMHFRPEFSKDLMKDKSFTAKLGMHPLLGLQVCCDSSLYD